MAYTYIDKDTQVDPADYNFLWTWHEDATATVTLFDWNVGLPVAGKATIDKYGNIRTTDFPESINQDITAEWQDAYDKHLFGEQL